MQQERLDVGSEIGDQKRRAMRHEAADEMNVTRQPVEFGDGDRRPLAVMASFGQGGGELRAAIENVRALASLDLDMLGDDLEPLGLGEAGDGGPLSVNAEAAATLVARRNSKIGDDRLGHGGDPRQWRPAALVAAPRG